MMKHNYIVTVKCYLNGKKAISKVRIEDINNLQDTVSNLISKHITHELKDPPETIRVNVISVSGVNIVSDTYERVNGSYVNVSDIIKQVINKFSILN